MVSRFLRTLGVAALILVIGSGRLAAGGQADVDSAALAVAQMYFAALQSGDRQALLSLLADRALERNKAQLEEPAYSQFLTDRYSNARFEVSNGGVKNGVTFVDITIWLNNTETIKERLVLKPSGDPTDPSLHIVAQQELPD